MAFMALQAPGDDSAHLIYEFERRAYPVRNSLLTIGRDAASHILIREPAVSRNHAELRSEDGKFVLHPCGVNPTTVNGMTLAEPRTLAEGDKVEVELSLSGSPPAKDNDARRGMPDLDATLELGPSLNITLFRSENRNEKLELRLPVRTVFSSDFSHVRQTGWVFQPNLSLDFKNVLGDRGWKLGLQGSLIYADRRYNQYFYAVDPVFVTPARPAFDPSGGYGGLNFLAAVSKHFPGFWVGGFAKWDSVSGAVFADSPLVRARSNFSGGFAVAWIFRASTAKVEAEN